MKFHFFYIIKMEWYEYPNNNRPVMLDLGGKGYNVNSIHPNLLNTRIADAYMTYNPVIRPPGKNWVEKTTYIPIGSDPALSNSHSYNGDQRRAASVERNGSPLENNPCRVKRGFIYEYCHRDEKVCTEKDNDENLRKKHNRWMTCRNVRAEFQNSNCRIDSESPEWVDPSDRGHIERIKVSAKEAKNCVEIYNHKERVARRAFEAGEDIQAPPEAQPAAARPSAASSVKPRSHIPPHAVAASAASSVQSKLRSSIPPHAVASSVASSVPPPVSASLTPPKPSSKFKERLAAALFKPNKFLSKRKKSKTKKSKKKSKKKSIRRH